MRKSLIALLTISLFGLMITPAFAQISATDANGNPVNVKMEQVPLQTVPTDLASPVIQTNDATDKATTTTGSDAPTIANESAAQSETVASGTESDASEGIISLRRVAKWGGLVVAVLLVIVILMQERGVGLSSTFGGSGGGSFYANKRGVEKVLFRATIGLAVLFAILNILAMLA